MVMPRAFILVADGFGIGAAPDANAFGDVGSHTLGHIAEFWRQQHGTRLDLPNLVKMGLKAAADAVSEEPVELAPHNLVAGAYGAAREIGTGKDTPSGHWEMTGVPVLFDWGYYPDVPNCFPEQFMQRLQEKTGVPGFLGNCHASGTDIIRALGDEHMKSGKPICYTSADSVFQVAAHETSFGLDRLLEFCEAAREMLYEDNIGRVIARPFTGTNPEDFVRTGNRRDYSIEAPAPTLLDKLVEHGGTVHAIGKISDIFAGRGITTSTKATGLPALLDATAQHILDSPDGSLTFTNLVNFDQDFGHRRDPIGYAEALVYFDGRLSELLAALGEDDLLIITADHGCDPTYPGTEHTREYVPVLAYRPGLAPVSLGERASFADIGQSLAGFLGVPALDSGESFLAQVAR